MNEFFKNPRVKITGVIIVIIVLYIYYSVSSGNFRLSKVSNVFPQGSSSSRGLAFPEEFAGFSGGGTSAYDSSVKREVGIAPQPPMGGAGTTNSSDAQIIQSGNLSLEVETVSSALNEIKEVAKKHNGFIINSDFRESTTGIRSGSAQVKVPFAEFDATLTGLKEIAQFVEQESISSQDVTEEYTDLVSQLRNLKAEEAQYLEIIKTAKTIEETLQVSQRLYDVRGRIEQAQGRINYYDARTEYSVINVHLAEESTVQAPTNKWRPWAEIKQSAQRLVVNLQNFVTNVVAFVFWLVALIPYLLLMGVIWWVARGIYRRMKQPVSSSKQKNL